jgi:pimeloyl-ACP methyl ester carboxylesterase
MQTTLDDIDLSSEDTGLGRPLVFLHGFPLSRSVWQKQIDAFRSSYRVIAPDLCGFGVSPTRFGATTMAQYAGDIHRLLEKLTTGPVVLVGHSMGGYVALAFARQFPEMLSGLVLVSTKAGQDTTEVAVGRRATADKVKAEGVHVVVDTMAPKMLSPRNQDESLIGQVRGLMSSSHSVGVNGALLGMAERPDSTALLSQIVVPTLIITGTDDAIVPREESEKMAQGIRGSQLREIFPAGHLVAFEQPEEFNRVLKEWLSEKDARGPHQPRSDRET